LLLQTILTIALVKSDVYAWNMGIVEVEKLALNLSERQRAELATNLLKSLPPVLSDGDEGIAEALRRDAQIDAGATETLSLEQLDSEIQSRRS
jgi:hypothetical protein